MEYDDFLKSQLWRDYCEPIKERARGCCEFCRLSCDDGDCHHVTYEFGLTPKDIRLVKYICPNCHYLQHEGAHYEFENQFGHWCFYKNGRLHREDGPAMWSTEHGWREWHLDGRLHRKDGPAVEWDYGRKEWWCYGRPLDGPAQ